MSSHNKTAIIITQNELINNWLASVISVVGEDTYFFVVQESNKFKKIDTLFLKLNFKIFGRLKKEKINSIFRVNFIDINELEDTLRDFQTIFNFTSLELSITKSTNHLQFLIFGKPYCLLEVVSNTLTSYKKVELEIESNIESFKTSTIRLDPFSIAKNIELILASFLVLLKTKNTYNTEVLLKNKRDSASIALKDYFKYTFRLLKKLKHYFFYNEQWVLGYCFNPKEIGVDLKNDFKIIPPKDRFWADPVVVEDNDRYYVFIEELIYKNKKAHLSVFELNEDGTYTEPEIILKKPYHLSYPFIFKEQGKYYMIPETAHNNDIQLYEAVSFPFKWEFRQNLMEHVKAADTTLLFKDNKWWLFTSIKRFEKGTYDNDLSVFYSDNLFSSNWTEHQENPVLKDITMGRPGGPFINISSDYYRVSQNCESNYGYGFNLSKVQTLSDLDFKEEKVYSFTPKNFKNVLGVHTYNHINSKLRVYDILTRTFKY